MARMSGTASVLTILGLVSLFSSCGVRDEHTAPPESAPGAASADPDGSSRAAAAMESLPLVFIENRGQVDPAVGYYVQGHDKSLYFTSEGITFALTDPPGGPPAAPETPRRRWAVKLDFLGARPGSAPVGEGESEAVVSYFKGPREQWKTGVPTHARVVYPDLWPGIDLVYAGTVNRLKYSFLVKPGADPAQIKLAYRGATAVRLDEKGRIEVSTPLGGFHDDAPYVYQDIGGERVEVESAYALDEVSGAYGFHLGAHDSKQPLVLDPAVFVYSGFIGGAGADSGNGIDVDSAGQAYVVGTTDSAACSFPVAVGPDLTFNGGDSDAFVAKVRADGTGLVFAGYIGGSGTDSGNGIAVDPAGNAYVTGTTDSTEASFPVQIGPDLTYNGGVSDAFVAKINSCGTDLVYAGYIGGAGTDSGNGIAVDGAGRAFVTGTTSSTESTFPVRVGPDLTYNGGDTDAFVARVKISGSSLAYAGYIGGADVDLGNGIAVDTAGNAYVTGRTSSTEATFPVTVGPDLTLDIGADAFVAKIEPGGAAFVYAGYIGDFPIPALGGDGRAIAVDSAGNAYVTGTRIPFAFVAKVRADGTGLVYDLPLGVGIAVQSVGVGVDVDSAGNAYVIRNVGRGVNVSKINVSGTAVLSQIDIGGVNVEIGRGIAVDAAGNAYVTGQTSSSEDLGFPVAVGPDLTFNGGFSDAFVAKIAFADTEPPVAQCMDITISAGETCHVDASIDNGSFSPGGAPVTCTQTPSGPYPVGTTSVTLTCTDAAGLSSSCTADVTVAY
jgi:beta-propeller repeat-containing protein